MQVIEDNTDADGNVWYFAYGSNMNCKVLSGRRKVFPLASYPARLDGWNLTFHIPGPLKYIEPGMGTIEPAGSCPSLPPNTPPVHGVLHYITQADYIQIVRTEGGGGDPDFGYYTVAAPAEVILDEVPANQQADELPEAEAGPQPRAVVPVVSSVFPPVRMSAGTQRTIMEASKAAIGLGSGDGTARRFVVPNALTLTFREKDLKHHVTCSRRYWGLLCEGAREHHLPKLYQSHLATLRFYDPPNTLRLRLARFLMMLLGVPIFMPILFSNYLFGGRARFVWRWGLAIGAPILETWYRYFIKPWAGDGEC
ncbi:hypothetical protein M427DRAFT_61503 [Gonapodya prolifera JEL478]|uniref:gamma-glutamylcyclotransferase n=1 Tax=Gonapodya prolifera (strain JEL478) TaxID=1344416 RepID=A0A139A202_GONPJ|nr:hypothetical protein M427DRAFT_61503 [Gonapodya prolifera JEL478]|eukprot:KXS10771.1 hypothetical protein M427DRAFT_61503 [Gonapodya prolifera JEL478]